MKKTIKSSSKKNRIYSKVYVNLINELTSFRANNSVNTNGNPAEHANSTKLTDTAKPITPISAIHKLFSLVNFLIFLKIFFLFLSSTTSQPLSLLLIKLLAPKK